MPNYSPAYSPASPTYRPDSPPYVPYRYHSVQPCSGLEDELSDFSFASLKTVNIWFTRRNPFVYLDKIAEELNIEYKFVDFEKHLELYHSMVQTNDWNVIGKGTTLTEAREDAAKNALVFIREFF